MEGLLLDSNIETWCYALEDDIRIYILSNSYIFTIITQDICIIHMKGWLVFLVCHVFSSVTPLGTQLHVLIVVHAVKSPFFNFQSVAFHFQ